MTEEPNKRRKTSYDCQYCDKSYRKPSKLTEHERSHTGERPFVCTFQGCEKAYFRSTHLKVHEKSHLNIKDYHCSFEGCDAAFSTRQHLQRHEKIHVSPLIQCDFPGCSAEFSKRFQLRWHRASHEKGTHICHLCSSAFDSLPQLEKHKDRVHENPVIYQCSSCQDTFKKWSELRKHVRQNHPFTCSICEKTYARSSNLKQHFKEKHTEHEKVHCEWPGCTSVLQNKRSYKMHIALVHEQDTRYKCEICQKGFPYQSMLERHKGSHTPKSRPSPKKKNKSIAELLTGHNHYPEPKALPCPFANCSFEFTNTYLLKRHLESENHAEDVASFALQHQLEHTTSA
ncbi:Transcription factor IIIA [Choanephora cucurbitarum]|uniref:Transcription factor IIIA n=1 Tax=Choanephora cucurbitarum TaxID=101091 RepID=A0A1C7MZP8_9FUNG|nr:Transcription factor IIIA [Choanephora cucurbitarum]